MLVVSAFLVHSMAWLWQVCVGTVVIVCGLACACIGLMTLRASMFCVGLCLCMFTPAIAMEPLALLATQPAWQAAQPITVNVDYDGTGCSSSCLCSRWWICVHAVPAFGTMDEVADLQDASMIEYKVAKRCECSCPTYWRCRCAFRFAEFTGTGC
jgi:hypothetical protein